MTADSRLGLSPEEGRSASPCSGPASSDPRLPQPRLPSQAGAISSAFVIEKGKKGGHFPGTSSFRKFPSSQRQGSGLWPGLFTLKEGRKGGRRGSPRKPLALARTYNLSPRSGHDQESSLNPGRVFKSSPLLEAARPGGEGRPASGRRTLRDQVQPGSGAVSVCVCYGENQG